jgi:hypothetical protein
LLSYLIFYYLVVPVRNIEFVLRKFLLFNYLYKVFYYFIKFSALLFALKFIFYVVNVNVSWRSSLKSIIICEFIFFIPDIFKLIWFIFIDTNYSEQDIHSIFLYTSINGLLNLNSKSILGSLFVFFNIFDISYSLFANLFVCNFTRNSYEDTLLQTMLIYASLLTVVSIFSYFVGL